MAKFSCNFLYALSSFFHQWHMKWKKGDLEKFRKGTSIIISIIIVVVVVIAAVVVSYINIMIVIQSILRVVLI